MPRKSEALVARVRRIADGAWRGLGLIKYLVVAFVLTLLAAIISITIWARVRPISEYRDAIASQIAKALHADDVSIKEVNWAVEWSSFSVGIEAKQVQYKDLKRAIEGAIPSLKIMWSPIKIMIGSVSITLHADDSTWQLGEQGASALGGKPPVSIFKDFKQPTFLEGRVDIYLKGKGLTLSMAARKDNLLLFKEVKVAAALMGLRSHFNGVVSAELSKSTSLGKLSGTLSLDWQGAFQYVDKVIVGTSIDRIKVDFTKATIDGWGLYKSPHDPLDASFGVQVLIDEDGEFTTVDVKGGKLRFADLNFVFDGDQKNASGAAFKWVLENQQLNKNKLPFQIIHQAKASGPVQAEGRVSLSKGWDFSSVWSLRANGINFKVVELAQQFDPRSEGSIVFNVAFDGGFEEQTLHSSGFQLKVDAKDALLISKDQAFTKPKGQAAEVQVLAEIVDDKLLLKPSFFVWADFRGDIKGQVEGLSDYLLRDSEAAFQLEAHTGKVDISRIAPLLSFLRQNPVPSGSLEFSGAMSGSLGKKSLAMQLEDKELAWRIDRLALSAFRAGVDTGAWFVKQKDAGYFLDGIIESDLSLRARGRGFLVQTSNVQADVDVTNAEFVWADEFRKPNGVQGRIKVGLTSVPNKIEFKSSRISFLDTGIDFAGVLSQGSRSRIALSIKRPIDLSKWRGFFRAREDTPLQGQVDSQLFLSLLTTPDQMDGGIDWRRVGVAGTIRLQDLRGLRGPLSSLDHSSGAIRFADGKIHLQNFNTSLGEHRLNLSGAINPVGQKGSISFYDLASVKKWNANLAIRTDKLNPVSLLKSLYPELGRAEQTKAIHSLEPSAWLNPDQIATLRKWPLLKSVKLKTKWDVKEFHLGPWALKQVQGNLTVDDAVAKFSIGSATWLKQASLSGAGIWDFKPTGNVNKALPLSGTWNFKRAPMSELLSRWDLRESKVLQGSFSGTLVYAIEKSQSLEDEDTVRMNLEGNLTDADHSVMKIIKDSVQTSLKDLGTLGTCFATKWQGTIRAWTTGDGALRIDDAKWQGEGARIGWSVKTDKTSGATVIGKWIPTTACLGPKVAQCWNSASNPMPELGRFTLSGAWDKLSFAWSPDVWGKLHECVNAQNVAKPEGRSAVREEARQSAELKNYLKKNAN